MRFCLTLILLVNLMATSAVGELITPKAVADHSYGSAFAESCDGKLSTFTTLPDDTCEGNSDMVGPPWANPPVTGTIVYDLGKPMFVYGISITAQQYGFHAPKNISVYGFNPDDEYNKGEGTITLIEHRELPYFCCGQTRAASLQGAVTRYVRIRFNDAYDVERDRWHLNQFAEIRFFACDPKDADKANSAADMFDGKTLKELDADKTALPVPPHTVLPANRGDDWWKQRHAENKARIDQGDVDLLLVGDSITHGWDDAGKKVRDYYYGDRKCVNMGFFGDQTQHVLWRLNDAPMDKIHPKAAMIMIGINCLWGSWEDCEKNTALGVKACVDKLRDLYPDMPILVLDIFPGQSNPGDGVRIRQAKTNIEMRSLLKGYKNVTLMDINHLWLTGPNGWVRDALVPDGCHPNEAGYKLWGAEVEPWIANALGVKTKKKLD